MITLTRKAVALIGKPRLRAAHVAVAKIQHLKCVQVTSSDRVIPYTETPYFLVQKPP